MPWYKLHMHKTCKTCKTYKTCKLVQLVPFDREITHANFGGDRTTCVKVMAKKLMHPSSRTRDWLPSVLSLRGLWRGHIAQNCFVESCAKVHYYSKCSHFICSIRHAISGRLIRSAIWPQLYVHQILITRMRVKIKLHFRIHSHLRLHCLGSLHQSRPECCSINPMKYRLRSFNTL